jgi:tetratricopeptide (TPR) repeat protein
MSKRARFFFLLALAALAVSLPGRCASAPPPSVPRDRFPLDPREGIAGPFDASVEEGWRALSSGNAARARMEFARVKAGPSLRVATIGMIEALVLERRAAQALELCTGALASGKPTVPLLTSCGEARASRGEPVQAFELYERAVARAPDRTGLAQRAEELRADATDSVLAAAGRAAAEGRPEEARLEAARALAWNPGSASVLARAAEVECDAGDRERALQYYREALTLGGLDSVTEQKAGDLALEAGDYAMAVFVFEGLAAHDPRMRERAEAARLAFRMDNWPDAERQAARARRVTRSGAASITWWMFPEVRDAKVRSGVVATDVLERRDSRSMMRAIALGLLDVDPETHRARPDAALGRAAAAQMMLRLAAILGSPGWASGCLTGAADPARSSQEAIRLATRCGLLSESAGQFVGGAEFTRGLDRLRSLLPSGEAANRD